MIKKVILISAALAVSLLMFMNCDVMRLVNREEYLGIKKNSNEKTYSITVNPGSGENILKDIAADRNFIYLAGSDTEISSSDSQMRLEKRYKSTGELDASFGHNGVVQYNFRADNSRYAREMISKISIDNDYIYLGCIVYEDNKSGFTGNACWQIQKRHKNTGELVKTFGKNGLTKPSAFRINNTLNALITDDNYIYIAGESIPVDHITSKQSGSAGWHLEKRYKFDGALVKSFNNGGTYQFDYTRFSDTICDIKINDNYIYAAGYDNNNQEINTIDDIYLSKRYTITPHPADNTDYGLINQTANYYQWRIEKINKDTGVPDNAFGTNGVIRQKFGLAGEKCEKIAIDDNYLYLTGTISLNSTAPNYIRIEKRYLTTGELVDSFGNCGIINKFFSDRTKTIGSFTILNDILYSAEYNSQNSSTMFAGTIIEKRNSFRGAVIREFADNGIIKVNNNEIKSCEKIIADEKFIYLACNEGTVLHTQWRLEKRYAETGGF